MANGANSLEIVKQKILELKDKPVDIKVNKGRNRIVKLQAVVTQVYPSMFVIKPLQKVDLDRLSFSYNDVLCGDIIFAQAQK